MNSEAMAGLERRAAVHAALADPSRLRITDTLADGDASPSELSAMLSMPSNLLAHHLRVLEDAGLVARRRSDGDRRRTYLRLLPAALDAPGGPPRRAARRVLFVCTAQLCPLALGGCAVEPGQRGAGRVGRLAPRLAAFTASANSGN